MKVVNLEFRKTELFFWGARVLQTELAGAIDYEPFVWLFQVSENIWRELNWNFKSFQEKEK